MLKRLRTLSVVLAFAPGLAMAQGAPVAFSGLKHDSSLPVEVTSDQLTVNQTDGTALFNGNVLVVQGDMKLTAGRLRVEYTEDRSAIARLHAFDGVTMVNATDAAESREAVYTIETSNVVMTGDVLLTQGTNALSGNRLVIDLNAGTGVMEGRVQTVFLPKKDNK